MSPSLAESCPRVGNLPGKVTPVRKGHSPDQRRGSWELLAASTYGSWELAPAPEKGPGGGPNSIRPASSCFGQDHPAWSQESRITESRSSFHSSSLRRGIAVTRDVRAGHVTPKLVTFGSGGGAGNRWGRGKRVVPPQLQASLLFPLWRAERPSSDLPGVTSGGSEPPRERC